MKCSNQKDNKINNRNTVLKLLSLYAPISRIELSKMTGLSKMSLTNIIFELINEGIVCEIGTDTSLVGRKRILLDIVQSCIHAVGIYISRDFIECCVSDLCGELKHIEKTELSIYENNATISKKIVDLIGTVLSKGEYKRLCGIGVSSIGPLDSKNGVILSPPNFYNISNLNIKELLENNFNLPVFLDNDMNTSALAEKYYGNAKHISNFIYIGVTNGIGVGIVTNNTLYVGDMGFGGELGHISINFDGERCPCGNIGCLELYASIPVIENMAKISIELGVITMLSGFEIIDFTNIIECANQGDDFCIRLIDKLCYCLSFGIINILNLFDPQVIFLGHDIALDGGSLIIERLQQHIYNRTISREYKNIELCISKFAGSSPLIGSVALVFDMLLR